MKAVVFISAVCISGEAFGQWYPERSRIRSGNRQYEKQDYLKGEEKYRQAVEAGPSSYEARFNLGDALYKQGRMEDAGEEFKALTEDASLIPEQRAKAFYNLGNTQFGLQKLEDALESYKSSLRLNPDDMEAKYNLSYVQKLLEQQEDDQNQDGGDNNNDQNQNDQDNQNQNEDDQNEDDQDQNDDNNDQDENNDDRQGEGEDDRGQQPPPPEKPSPSEDNRSGIDKNDAEAMLNAMQSQEDKTRDKVNAQKAVGVGASGKNW